MKLNDSFPKIYVLGPEGSGKSTFIQKHLSKEINDYENLVVESSEMILPEKYLKIFLILPNQEELAKRKDVENSDEEYHHWLDFYSKNKSSIDIVWVKL